MRERQDDSRKERTRKERNRQSDREQEGMGMERVAGRARKDGGRRKWQRDQEGMREWQKGLGERERDREGQRKRQGYVRRKLSVSSAYHFKKIDFIRCEVGVSVGPSRDDFQDQHTKPEHIHLFRQLPPHRVLRSQIPTVQQERLERESRKGRCSREKR